MLATSAPFMKRSGKMHMTRSAGSVVHVNPKRWIVGQLEPDGDGRDRDAHAHYDEERRTVRGVGKGQVEAADVAALR